MGSDADAVRFLHVAGASLLNEIAYIDTNYHEIEFIPSKRREFRKQFNLQNVQVEIIEEAIRKFFALKNGPVIQRMTHKDL